MLRHFLLGFGATVLLALLPGAAVAAEPIAISTVPSGFRVPATNGWRATVIGGTNAKTGESAVMLDLLRHGERAFYVTLDATVTESTVEGSFGGLGEIDVHAVPTAGTSTESSSCGGRSVAFPSGRWEGTISFAGEEGFTSIQAASAPAAIAPTLDLTCGEESNEGVGGHSPGALLSFERVHGKERLELTARKNKRHGPSRFVANISEERGKLFISRVVSATGASGAFEFAIPPGTATARPSKPFSGSLGFIRTRGAPRLTGDLKIDFPGRAHVPLLGPGKTHASLYRAVLNPSHPF